MVKKTILMVSFALAAAGVCAQDLYRYVDQSGVTVLARSIPPEYVSQGYEIINAQGHVIQTVLPKAVIDSHFNKLTVDQSDNVLLTSYSTVSELEEHRSRKVSGVEREIGNLESDQRVLALQMAGEVAERERLQGLLASGSLSARENAELQSVKNNIEYLAEVSMKLRGQLERREHVIVAIRNEYALKIERFTQLQQAGIDVRQTSLQSLDQGSNIEQQ